MRPIYGVILAAVWIAPQSDVSAQTKAVVGPGKHAFAVEDLSKWVDPFVGTSATGHTDNIMRRIALLKKTSKTPLRGARGF
jgi:hypothetical protein